MSSIPQPASPAPLFRSQALAAAGQRLHGDILLARPVAFSLLTGLFVSIAFGICLFFAFFGYTRKVQVGGTIAPTTGIKQ